MHFWCLLNEGIIINVAVTVRQLTN